VNADEARLHAHLDQNPEDLTSRQILADLLDDEGQPDAARFQRWLVTRHLWPDSNLAMWGLKGWHWWSNVEEPHRKRAHALVPGSVRPFMPAGEWIYPTRAEAEAALDEALARSEVVTPE
jgi:uncharacterized protein (TIGR02996 family)